MAERRPITARDVKSNVEGYSEMSDEAFARRFYSDRAELLALGVPLNSQRDEFTGEELYTLRSEQYFLPQLELDDAELAALQTALYLLEGKFAYAEPLRLALQNLALGRPGFAETTTETALRVEVLDPDYSPEMPGRLAKLEGAISKQRTVKFDYWSISRDELADRTVNPYALMPDNGIWYVVGYDLDREDIRTFRVSRIRGEIKFATRRERDFRTPTDFDIEQFRGRPPWQVGDIVGEAKIEVRGDTAWWVQRAYGLTGRLEDGVFVTDYSSLSQLASWVLRQDGPAVLPQHPGGELREGGVVGDEDAVLESAGQSVRALDPPRGVAAHLDLGLADDVADLPRRPAAELLDVEVGRRAEVALAPRGELDLAADPRDAERADVFAVEVVADDVPDAVVGHERVRVDRPVGELVARDRPVVELHRALLRDRALELRQAARHLGGVVGIEHLDPQRRLGRRLGEP